MARRQVWVLEYLPYRGKNWIVQSPHWSRRDAKEYQREFHEVNPSLANRTRVVKYTPEKP